MVSGSLYFNNCVVAMSMVSTIGMLTYRSFMSSIINLCLLLMLSRVRSCARVDEFIIV